MSNQDNATQNLDDDIDLDLLDKNLTDIEDLPSFEVPPRGTYTFLVNAGTKKVNGHPCVTLDYEVVDTIQLADPTKDKAPVPGSKFNSLFMLDNEFGEGNMKKNLAPYAEFFGTDNVKVLVKEKIQNVVIQGSVKHRKDKDDPDRVYGEVKNVTIQQ